MIPLQIIGQIPREVQPFPVVLTAPPRPTPSDVTYTVCGMNAARDIRGARRARRLLAVAAALGALVAPVRAEVTGRQVRRALDQGVRALKRHQLRDGSWAEMTGHRYAGGVTCLVTLALLRAGEPPASPSISAALERIRALDNRYTYVVSLKIMALAAADAAKYHTEIGAAAHWLVSAQRRNGLWSYETRGGTYDHSNTQFALLGLHAAAQAGIRIAPRVWKIARNQLMRNQKTDGGWAYRNSGESYGSMTAAGVADLLILGSSTAITQEHGFRNGAAPGCGGYKTGRALARGLAWLGDNFRTLENPRRGRAYVYYWLYAVERCGILSGRRYFGRHDWYREGAEFLVRSQNADGTWGNGVIDTSFAVLFLAKGRKPLLIQKLRWSDDDRWDPDRHDVEHLVSFIGDKLGEPTSWQVVDFDAPLEQWLAAPLLYFQGHEFPRFSARQRQKLRNYVEQGGTLLAEACCGRKEFINGFKQFCTETFPGVPLHKLDPGHPVYSAHYDLKPAGLMGLDVGCRTSVIFSPRDFSCLWEQGDVPRLSEQALRLGTNIAAFATGRQALRDRLDVVTLPDEGQDTSQTPPPGDALRLAQVVYDGDWHPDPQALVKFAEYLRDNLHMDVVTRYKPVRLTDADLRNSPILYMTGHYHFELSEQERTALAAHLRRGGFLFADACCGREAFDAAFRAMVEKMFPNESLRKLPPDHPIFRGQPGFRLDTIGYKPAALADHPGLKHPELWGLEIDGRLAIVYSPFAIGCGLDGHVCYNCRGYLIDDARRLAANIVLYALTH